MLSCPLIASEPISKHVSVECGELKLESLHRVVDFLLADGCKVLIVRQIKLVRPYLVAWHLSVVQHLCDEGIKLEHASTLFENRVLF